MLPDMSLVLFWPYPPATKNLGAFVFLLAQYFLFCADFNENKVPLPEFFYNIFLLLLCGPMYGSVLSASSAYFLPFLGYLPAPLSFAGKSPFPFTRSVTFFLSSNAFPGLLQRLPLRPLTPSAFYWFFFFPPHVWCHPLSFTLSSASETFYLSASRLTSSLMVRQILSPFLPQDTPFPPSKFSF